MRTRLLVSVIAAATLTGATLLGVSLSGATASTVTNATVHIIAYGDGAGPGETDIFTGAIGDSGSGISVDANGTADPGNGTEQQFMLVHGSFRVNTQALDKKISSAFNSFTPSSTTCSGMITVTGTAQVVSGSGTGAYAGITGSFTVTVLYAAILPKIASGKNKGHCNESNNAQSIGSAQIVTGSGTVSY